MLRAVESPPFRVVSMDPGGDTGLARFLVGHDVFRLEDTDVVGYRPEQGITPLKTLRAWAGAYKDDLPVTFVYENFHVRPGKSQADTTALEIIGAVREWHRCEHPYTELVPREPVQGKSVITDDILLRMGLLRSGGLTRHVNDATRHAVSWLAACGYLPVCVAAWGEP